MTGSRHPLKLSYPSIRTCAKESNLSASRFSAQQPSETTRKSAPLSLCPSGLPGLLLIALLGLLLLGIQGGSAHAADPTITNAEDELFWDNGGGDGESVTIDGTNFDGDSRIYLSSNNTLDAGDVLQGVFNLDSGTQMTFTVNRGALPKGGMYLFVTNDTNLGDGVDPALTSDPYAIQVGRQWSPGDITTLGWWDPSDGTTISATGNSITQLRDKSGLNNHLYNMSDPETGIRTINGLNVIDCDGDDYLRDNSIALPASGNAAFFMVAEVDVVSYYTDGLIGLDTNSGVGDPGLHTGGSMRTSIEAGGIGSNANGTGGPYYGPSVYNMNLDWDSSVFNAFVDGGQTISDHAYTTKFATDQKLFLFAKRGNAMQKPDGAFGETIIIEDVTDATRELIEGYLADKWGTQAGLPGGHPYKVGGHVVFDPVLDLDTGTASSNFAITYAEGDAPTAILTTGGDNLTDADSVAFDSVTVSFDQTTFADGAAESLKIAGATVGGTISDLGGLTNGASGTFTLSAVVYDFSVSVAGNTATITFTGDSAAELTEVQAEALLDALRYENTDTDLTTGSDRVLTLVAADDAAYASNSTTCTIFVVPIPITLTAGANNKVYDATTSVAAVPTITAGALRPGDTGTWVETYDTKHVGTNKTLTPTGTVRDAGNNDVTALYDITFVSQDLGTITPRPLTVTATGIDKVYDGTTDATVNLHGNHIGGDAILLHYSDARFDTPNIGASKPVAVAGITVTGADAHNYDLQNTSTATTATIYGSYPTILRHPLAVTRNIYDTATFDVVAVGSQPLTYQWFKNGALIPGATSYTYTTPPVTQADQGATFIVRVRNAYGTAWSNGAQLTVNTSGDGLNMTRYNNTSFSGSGTTYHVPNVNTGGIPGGTSTRWEGSLTPVTTGTYHFYARTNGPVRMYLDGQLVVNGWGVSSPQVTQGAMVLQTGRRYRFQMDFVNSGYAILEWGLPGWGPIPGGPAGMHEIIPQSQFFRNQLITGPSTPTARPRTTNPEEPLLPPTQPPGDLPEPNLPPPTPPTAGPENPGTSTPGGVIPRIPPLPPLPPDDTPEIPFAPEQPLEPGNGPETGRPVEPPAETQPPVEEVPLRHGRDQDVVEQDVKTLPPVAPIEMTGMAAEGVIPFAAGATDSDGPEAIRPVALTRYPCDVSRGGLDPDADEDVRTTFGATDSGIQASMCPVAERRYSCDASQGEPGNTPAALPLFGWTWVDMALVGIIPLLLLVVLLAWRRRKVS